MAYKIRTLIASAFLALAARFVSADTLSIGGGWGGLHNSDSSMSINDNEAQDLLNVEFTRSGFGIKKREGYTQFRTIGTSTWAVRGGYFFRDASGVDNIIFTNNQSVYKSFNGGAFAAFITTDTAGSYYDFTDSNGWLYRATSNHDEICRYNGTTLTYFPTAPKGSIVEMLSDRLLISGTTDYPNRLYYSAQADPTDFVTGVLESSAFTYDHGLPGAAVTALKAWNNGVIVWTKNTMSYVVYNSQFDLTPVTKISGTVGCTQPYSVIDDYGVIFFEGQDKHWYSFDGNGLAIISSQLDVSNIVASAEDNVWEQSTSSDFNLGTIPIELDSYTYSGSLVQKNELHDDFSDGDLTNAVFWSTSSSNGTGDGMLCNVVSGKLQMGNGWGNSAGGSGIASSTFVNAHSTGTWYLYAQIATGGAGRNTTWIDLISPSSHVVRTRISKVSSTIEVGFGTDSTVYSSNTYASIATNLTISRDASDNWVAKINGVVVGSATFTGAEASDRSTINRISLNMSALTTTVGATATSNFDNIGFAYETGTFISSNFTMPADFSNFNISSYDSNSNGGTITYGLYSDTDTVHTITNPATFVASQTFTSGSIPALTTSTYLFYTATLARGTTVYDYFNESKVEYRTGTTNLSYGVVDHLHRLIWGVADDNGLVTNKDYIYDQRFNDWLKFDIPFGAPVRVGENIYFGGTGAVYQYPSSQNDNGSAISAYWKSKDFIGGDPYVEKDYVHYGIVGKSETGSNLDLTYTVNTSTAITRNYSLTETEGRSLKRINEKIVSGKYGTFFNFQFGNDDLSSPFEIYAISFEYNKRPWRVLP